MRIVGAVVTAAILVHAAARVSAQDSLSAGERHLAVLTLRGQGAYERALQKAKRLAFDHRDLDVVHRTIADLYHRLGDTGAARRYFEEDPDSAYAHYGLARIDFQEGDLDGAIEHLKRSIELEPDFAEPFGPGGLPDAYRAKRDLDTAIAYFETLTRASPESANAFSGLGWSYVRSFQYDLAIHAFENAVELDPNLTQAYHGLVHSFYRTGRNQKGLEFCSALRRAAQRDGDLETLAYADMVEGTIASYMGDYRTALRFLHQSLETAREIGDKQSQASVVNNSATVYAMAGDLDKALEFFETSLELARSGGDESRGLNALGNIGTVHKDSGRYDEAIAHYRQAAALEREAGFRSQLSSTLANMAEAYQLRGDHNEATRYFNEALELAGQVQNTSIEAYVLGLLGVASRDRGDYAEALAFFERELAIGERTGEIQAIWEAQAGLGSTYEQQGDAEKAIAHYAEAIALYDSIREDLAVATLGSSFLEDKYEAYASIVQLLAKRGAVEEAFVYAEKYKAKGFLDILAQGRTLFETQLPEELLTELDEVRSELRERYAERSESEVSDIALDERITHLELRKTALLDRVRKDYGSFYDLAVSEPLDIESLQTDVLQPGQVLIEYLMGAEILSVFVVTQDELHYREIPVGRDELRRQLSELSPLFETEGIFNSDLADFSLPPAEALYQTLLAPVADLLTESTELIIVPDDFLFYLPFEVLVAESEGAGHRYDFGAATFVVERYAVSYSPSASLLDPRLRRPRQFAKGVLAFGNPAFSEAADQPPLPNSEAEVAGIRDAFRGLDNGVFTGKEATEAVFKREAGDYGVLHFATHFLSDDRQPLFSRIVLAGDEAEDDDGILQTYEVFDTKLNAELAVLSACNTGLGQLRKGEGLIGISRAFLYAGVPSLVMSLWSVDDKATARIMELFYRHLRSGLNKKQALRQAKLDYLDSSPGDAQDPFYWAPFILSGDWQPLQLPVQESRGRTWLVAGLLLALVCGIVWRHRTARS